MLELLLSYDWVSSYLFGYVCVCGIECIWHCNAILTAISIYFHCNQIIHIVSSQLANAKFNKLNFRLSQADYLLELSVKPLDS